MHNTDHSNVCNDQHFQSVNLLNKNDSTFCQARMEDTSCRVSAAVRKATDSNSTGGYVTHHDSNTTLADRLVDAWGIQP